MRRSIGMVLVGLGGALLLAAVVALVWAPGQTEKTPLDIDSTTRLSGTAAKLDTSTGELVENPILATNFSKVDADASTEDVAVWVQTTCVVIDEGNPPDCVDRSDDRLFQVSTDIFATDRTTAEAVEAEELLPPDAIPHEGIVNKFPFDTEKKDYPYWDGTTGAAVQAVYDREESIDGVTAYVFEVTVDDAAVEVAEGVPGTYSTDKEIWVEPRTGAILDQHEHQTRFLEDGTQALDLQLAFTEDQVASNVADAEDNVASLDLLGQTVPIIGFVGGGLALVAGLVLSLRRRDDEPTALDGEHREPVGVA